MQTTFEQLVAKNQGRIRYIASRYSLANEQEDMYQEILMQLWRSFDSFSGESTPETWVYKVALNTACTFVRKSIRQSEDTTQAPSLHTPSQNENACQADILEDFMNSLNNVDANILMMYLDGLSSEQSAMVLGITSNAVRARIKRIKQQFEQQFIEEQS